MTPNLRRFTWWHYVCFSTATPLLTSVLLLETGELFRIVRTRADSKNCCTCIFESLWTFQTNCAWWQVQETGCKRFCLRIQGQGGGDFSSDLPSLYLIIITLLPSGEQGSDINRSAAGVAVGGRGGRFSSTPRRGRYPRRRTKEFRVVEQSRRRTMGFQHQRRQWPSLWLRFVARWPATKAWPLLWLYAGKYKSHPDILLDQNNGPTSQLGSPDCA